MFANIPPVVKNLLIINALMLLATYAVESTMQINLRDYLGLHYMFSNAFNPLQYISYLFMHGDFMHLAFNMFALWMFGQVLEKVWGAKRFLIFYLVTGIGAGLLHTGVVHYELMQLTDPIEAFLADPSFVNFREYVPQTLRLDESFAYSLKEMNAVLQSWSLAPSDAGLKGKMVEMMIEYHENLLSGPRVVGASGSVFGILLAYGMMFPNSRLVLLFPPIPIKAKYFVIMYGALELYSGIQNNPDDNIAHFAHLGGMLFAFVLLRIWKQKRIH